MNEAALVLVAHGTRSPRGVEMIAALADAVAEQVGPTRVSFVDVLGPSPAEVLRDIPGPAVVVPAFLAAGYHVHTDVPREVADSGHPSVTVTRTLGPDPVLAEVLLRRLVDAGWQPGDAVVLAAAGSSDPRALRDVRRAAALLTELVASRVRIGYVATAEPRVADVVAGLRADGEKRVFVAAYLLAHGLFHARLADVGADGVAEPLGVDPAIVGVVAERYRNGILAAQRALSLQR
ncbi:MULTISPECIES: sirohydrochlorin chelatase [unclassified Rhodococcus (in: high G+C Gram-positive bacteria)]|uniref:sirohydrochlorin chelatase n=1 Tax=unclassified Rhodococcus (in: high G+C Gram-positive bacteria) TaxID=192944 RepID=UPI0016397E91|nr:MULTISPECIES: sirohydrochlorin chelatase [unclassified Rhodococcus (in: high G+C Gram-positive bacteria)]MBC2643575.1 sirohydrochlorin chelatase [Rhodococcus sp. 3A]MBC2891684.1 sirohydrochlorin chelatase [Rhodococcus sp. 4CII]